jgi:hypothetical protein
MELMVTRAFTRGLAVSVALAGAAVGLASPASAELTDGTYQMAYLANPGPAPITVVFTPCGDGCKSSKVVGPYEAQEFHLQGDTWTAPRPNGSIETIDNNTLTGQVGKWNVQYTKIS